MRAEESTWEKRKAKAERVRKGRESRCDNLRRLSLLSLPLLKRYQININAIPILKKVVRYFLKCLIASKGGTKIMDNQFFTVLVIENNLVISIIMLKIGY